MYRNFSKLITIIPFHHQINHTYTYLLILPYQNTIKAPISRIRTTNLLKLDSHKRANDTRKNREVIYKVSLSSGEEI